MKKLIGTLFWIGFSLGLCAQNTVRVNVVVPPPYPDYLSYYREPGRMVIMVQNLTNARQEIYLRGSIRGIDNAREIHTKPGYRPGRSIVIPAGIGQTVTISSEEIQELYKPANLNFFNTDSARIAGTDRVGEGLYSVCVRAYDYNQFTRPLSAADVGCATIFMRNLEAPMLIQPLEEAEIKSTGTQNVIFSWTRPAGAPVGTTYQLKIVEMFDPKRNPNDAYLSATRPAFFEQEVMNNVYVYGPADPPLTEGRKYAWAVTALDPDRRSYGRASASLFQNGGRSEIRAFTYQKPVYLEQIEMKMPVKTPVVVAVAKSDTTPRVPDLSGLGNMTVRSAPSDIVMCDCKEPIPQGTPAAISNGDDIRVNAFTMKVTSVQSAGEGRYSGTGTIPIPVVNSSVARLRVRFHDMEVVTVGSEKRMIAGEVKGIRRSDMSLLPDADTPGLSPAPLSTNDIHAIDNYFSRQKDQLVSNLKNSANSAGFELPVGLDEGPVTIGITQVFFTPGQAWFNAVASMDIPDGDAKAAFEISGACMKPTDLCNTFKLRLKEDLVLASMGMKLREGDLQGEGTYIIFNKKGFSELSLAVDYTFRGGIKPASGGGDLTARMNARTTKGWTDWVAEVTMPDFYIDGLQSVTFSLGNRKISYDHSDLSNPAGMPASLTIGNETYQEIGAKTWHGFYIPEITVKLPAVLKDLRNPDGRISFSGLQIVIDHNGFTGRIANTSSPIVPIGDGSMDGWYASVDQVIFNFFKSGFRESKMTGKLVLPASKDLNTQNQLDYVSLLSTAPGEGIKYNFTVKPKNDLKFDALFAVASISDNSHITVDAGAGQALIAKTGLHGKLTIKDITGATPISVSMPGVSFENLKFQTTAPFWDKSGFRFEFASPQKKLAGFNFTIDVPSLDVVAAGSGADVKVRFGGEIGLVEEVWTCEAKTAFAIKAKFTKASNGRIKFEGIGGELENIDFGTGVKLGPLSVSGYVKYYNRNNDEGFIGALHTQVAEMFGVTMRAQFGTKSDRGRSFKYFDFGAMVDFGQTGITFAPPVPLALYGFGGGISYNMRPDSASLPKAGSVPVKADKPSTVEPVSKYDSENTASSEDNLEDLLKSPTGITMTPAEGYFGVHATILFGLTSRNTLDADATLAMGFTRSGGVHYIRLTGNARILTDISKPLASRKDVSTGWGSLLINYDFEQKSFLARVSAGLGVPTYGNAPWIKADGFVEFAADRGGWHLYAGRPPGRGEGPNNVKMLRKDLLPGGSSTGYFFEGYSYFEVGSRVDPIPDIPEEVYQFAGSGEKQTGRVEAPLRDPNRGNYSPNKGLIVGAHTGYDTGKIRFLMFYGELEARSGFDISILSDVKCAGIENAGGPGGWYATGQAYFGAKAEIGVSVNLLLIRGDFSIFSGGAGAIIRAGLPNPTWAEGIVGGQFNILNGAVSGRFNLKMSIGTKCSQTTDVFGGLEIISEVQPAPQNDPPLNILSVPSVTFNLNVGTVFEFDDYVNLTKKGNPTKRFFMFDRECIDITMKKGNNAAETIPLTSMRNSTQPSLQNKYYVMDMVKVYGKSHLDKLTQYTFTVKAYMKEQYKFAGIESDYRYVGKNGGLTLNKANAAMQEMKTTFTTDKGFERIQKEEYWISAPLHSHRAVPYNEDPEHFIKFKNKLDLKTYIADLNESATYHIRVFRNGIKEGADIPVRIQDDIYTQTVRTGRNGTNESVRDYHMQLNFNKVALKPSSDYVFAIIAKNPVNPSGNQPELQRKEISGRLMNTAVASTLSAEERGFVKNDIKMIKNVVSGGSNLLGSGEFMIGGYRFRTSKYPTYEEKIRKTFELTKIKINQGQKENEIISAAGNAQKNRQLFEKYIKPDAEGFYTIIYGNTNFASEGEFSIDENFSVADAPYYYQPLTSDKLFNVASGSSKVIRLERKAGVGNITDQIPTFIAARTGIPAAKIRTKVITTYNEAASRFRDAGGYCQPVGGLVAGRNEAIDTGVGADVPEELPQAAAPQGSASSGSSSAAGSNAMSYSAQLVNLNLTGSNFSYIHNYVLSSPGATYSNSVLYADCRLGRDMVITNPIQNAIDRVINSRINPGDHYQSLNQVTTWQGVNQVSNGLKNGSVNPVQAGRQLGNVLMK